MASRTPAELLARVKLLVPWWLRPDPYLAGLAGAMAEAERVAWAMGEAAIVSQSTGVWLRLIARGLGLPASPTETDEAVRARIKAWPKRITREAVEETAAAFLDPLGVAWQIVEWHEAQVYLDETSTEYRTDLFCDERNMLVEPRTVYLYADDDGTLTEADELALCRAMRFSRAAGVQVCIVFDTDYGEIVQGSRPWSEA
jgi:hypothetical protein